ncbi:GntR family transcriptional regulator [Pseudoclavibacter chungangensis]|uniref:GntR family transcriptional regulator n=1 Tax=Pseudoclavibacter chungangensis TaxID=587635 RepID=A0A7J5C0X9_9MICO|nr:GntR family transcriptional regulator [Pseudoclavibacter chungangensis]KAB1660396.1 GntR family transcriptional regulator [Pseudoclavibacter chungangensis]NYJ65761.1 DNA-binding GntR family transcriptional regulator [Pseudoclavibacter chungangensis]
MQSGFELPWRRTDGALADRAAATVARRIVTGEIPPGELLTEAQVADLAGASRTPAREAMLQLANWRLVELKPKRGALVTTISPAVRRDLLEVRTMLETAAVRHLAERPDEQRRELGERLSASLARQTRAIADGDHLAFAEQDHAFHATIVAAWGNAVVAETMAAYGPRLARLIADTVTEHPESVDRFVEEHAALAALAESGDTEAFSNAIRAHVRVGHLVSEVA